jgi:hypothetical protein
MCIIMKKTKSVAARLSALLDIDFDWAETIIAEVEQDIADAKKAVEYWDSPEGRETRRADPERDRIIVEVYDSYGLRPLAGTEDDSDA